MYKPFNSNRHKICGCGRTYSYFNYQRHLRTRLHQKAWFKKHNIVFTYQHIKPKALPSVKCSDHPNQVCFN